MTQNRIKSSKYQNTINTFIIISLFIAKLANIQNQCIIIDSILLNEYLAIKTDIHHNAMDQNQLNYSLFIQNTSGFARK